MGRRLFVGLAFAVLLTSLVGCGEPMGTVSGTVKMDGQPKPGIQVEFYPVEGAGGSALGTTDDTGKYALQYPGGKTGAPPGEYVVRLSGVETDGAPPLQIPPRYNAESDLKKTVEAGTNVIDLEIESK
jgi:hypothetical protein